MNIKRKRVLQTGFGVLRRELLKRKRDIFLISFLGIFSALANGTQPYITGKFFDSLLEPSSIFLFGHDISLWIGIISLWVVVQLIANSTDWIINLKSRYLGTYIHSEYQSEAFSKVMLLPISFHKKHKLGDLGDKINRASQNIANITENVIINLAPQILSVAVGVTITFLINPILAIVAIAGVVIYIMILVKIVPPIVKIQKQGHKAWSDAYGTAYDGIGNIQTIKQSGAEEYESRRVSNAFINKAAKYWFKVEKIWNGVDFYQRMIVTVTQLVILSFSAYLIFQNELSIGELIAVTSYSGMIFGPFIKLGYNWQSIQNGMVALEKAEKILSMAPEVYEPTNSIELSDFKGKIEFRNVSFKYPDQKAETLKGLDFTVNPGETVALVGESGVGKTTTLELVSGYYFSSKGKVLIDGSDIKKVSLKELRSKIAIVPQEPVLFNDSIKNNIAYGNLKSTDKEITAATMKAHAYDFIQSFPKKWNQVVGERGVRLSVGQKQRVAIARAILRDPKILILDEPTSALDAKSEKNITDALSELMEGRTTFIIAHRLSTVRKADLILVFKDGQIVERGKHEELVNITNGIYKNLYNLQIGLHE